MKLYVKIDIIAIIIFGLFIHYYKRRTQKIAKETEKDDITTADYSIYIQGFESKKTSINERELKCHFK